PDPRPILVSVRDVPLDQGGKIVLRWQPSEYDVPNDGRITSYRVWRRAALAAAAAPGGSTSEALLLGVPGFWESLVEIPAAFLGGYAYTATTLNDSTAAGNPYEAFFIQALTSNRLVFYSSIVDSGYSV